MLKIFCNLAFLQKIELVPTSTELMKRCLLPTTVAEVAQMELTMMKTNLLKVYYLWILSKLNYQFWTSDRAISEDPCFAVKEVTKMIAKWSERFMADCGSHQKNPQIANKMNNIKTKMLSHLQSQAGYPFYFYILKNGMSSRWSFSRRPSRRRTPL